jgi:NTE family protein
MKAYGVLAGGGVKGAALAGCIVAARQFGNRFQGFAGSSAGACVALLSSIGYTDDELEKLMVKGPKFESFFDDSGAKLRRLRALPAAFRKSRTKVIPIVRHLGLLRQLHNRFGLYEGGSVRSFLLDAVKAKFSSLRDSSDVTFQDLERLECLPLKVLATDITHRVPVIYSVAATGLKGSVIDAVRASMCYPFVFIPVKSHERYYVDGGLVSNVPTFLFDDEQAETAFPIIAFDFASDGGAQDPPYVFEHFCGDMLGTALGSTDILVRSVQKNICHVRVKLPQGVDTLAIEADEGARKALFDAGYRATSQQLHEERAHWAEVDSDEKRVQAAHAPAALVETVLAGLVEDMATRAGAKDSRAYVMLPTGHGSLRVTYQKGLLGLSKSAEVAMAGTTLGRVWEGRRPIQSKSSILGGEASAFAGGAGRARTARSRTSYLLPVMDLRNNFSAQEIEELDRVGVLVFETSSSLQLGEVLPPLKRWADVCSYVLT